MEMDTVIARLRASREDAICGEMTRGAFCGDAWAQCHAEYTQLAALARYHDLDAGAVAADHRDYAEWQAEYIGRLLLKSSGVADDDIGSNEIAAFWNDVAEDEFPSDAFVSAFVKAACDL